MQNASTKELTITPTAELNIGNKSIVQEKNETVILEAISALRAAALAVSVGIELPLFLTDLK